MTLEELLNQTNHEEYDFKKEMSYYYEGMHIEKLPYQDNKDSTDFIAEFDRYKIADADLKGTVKLFDCDSSNDTCELTTQIYETLWDYVKNSENEIWEWEDRRRNTYQSSGGDTMNSFTTTRRIWENMKEGKSALYPMMNCFAKLTHTLGNFVLVPYGFNAARYLPTNDYWDAALKILEEKGFETKKGLLFKKENYKRYINYFFLWDYVEKDGYKAKPLFGKEIGKRARKPNGEKEITEYLQNVNRYIRRRGIFMVAMLRIATNTDYPDDYKKIMEQLCKPETLICSCEAACEQLSSISGLSKTTKEMILGAEQKIKKVQLL